MCTPPIDASFVSRLTSFIEDLKGQGYAEVRDSSSFVLTSFQVAEQCVNKHFPSLSSMSSLNRILSGHGYTRKSLNRHQENERIYYGNEKVNPLCISLTVEQLIPFVKFFNIIIIRLCREESFRGLQSELDQTVPIPLNRPKKSTTNKETCN